jgi:phenylalanyl-tRNA synthetase beta chain
MLLPLSWLAEKIVLQGSAEEICDLLTGAGIETELASDERPAWDGVVTAVLKSVEQHPDADKLTVTLPFDGTTERSVVCGATNHKAGDIVALATPGTLLPGGFKIKKSKLRGVRSEGMLCSEAELGLSSEAAGILILPADTELGVPLSSVLSSGDVILEVSPTANRGDCLSVLGLARELSAVTGWELIGAEEAPPANSVAMTAGARAGAVGVDAQAVEVALDAVDGCPRYTCALVGDVSVGPSPDWMSKRLEAMGVRSINNVVDCTNYVMLELGNPLHAFDRSVLADDEVRISWAGSGECVRTLDGVDHTLLEGRDLCIRDGQSIIALAGVMGGEDSEVRDDSSVLFLESAHFSPGPVRATAHRCKLSTESSYRFARGVDPGLPLRALLRLIQLLEETAGARLLGAPLDLYPEPEESVPVSFRFSRIAGLLGLQLSPARVVELLNRDGLEVLSAPDDEDTWTVSVPSYRFDIEREVDVLEEIARLFGYEEIPERSPLCELRSIPRQGGGIDGRALRNRMSSLGLSECIHFSFIDPTWLSMLGINEEHPWRSRAVRVANPLSEVGGILRPTLFPSLLRTVEKNRAMGAEDLRLFELRRSFLCREEGFSEILEGDGRRPLNRTPVVEKLMLSGVLSGQRLAANWDRGDTSIDFFDAKACVEAATKELGCKGFQWTTQGIPDFLDSRESAVLAGKGKQGIGAWVGRVAAPVLRAFDLDVVVYAFEMDVALLGGRKAKRPAFKPFSRFPGLERDLAFIAPDEVESGWLLDNAERIARKLQKDSFQGVEVFDVYRGQGIPQGSRSVGLRFRFRALDRTLEDKKVDGVMTQVERRLCEQPGVVLRS